MAKALSAAQRRAVTGSDPATGRLSARADVCAALVARGLAVPHGRSGHHSYYLSSNGLRLRAELATSPPPPPPAPGPGEAAGRAPGGGFVADLGTASAIRPGGAAGPGVGPAAGAGEPPAASAESSNTGPMGRRGDPTGTETGSAPAGRGELTGATGGGPAAGPGGAANRGSADRGPAEAVSAARRRAEVAAAWEGLLQIRALLLDGATDVPAPWERERRAHAVALALEAAGCPPARPDRAGYTVTDATAQPGASEIGWHGPATPGDQARALTECARLLETHGWQCTRHTDRAGRTFLLASPRHGR